MLILGWCGFSLTLSNSVWILNNEMFTLLVESVLQKLESYVIYGHTVFLFILISRDINLTNLTGSWSRRI